MQVNILLKGNDANAWFIRGDIHFIGYFFDSGNVLYRNQAAVDYIKNELKNRTLQDVCKNLNGIFAFIINENETCQIVSDTVNFFPIFYSYNDNGVFISDYWEAVVDFKKHFDFNTDAAAEYETAGFVLSNETLEKNIYKTNANQILTLSKNNASATQYKNYITRTFSEKSYDQLAIESEEVLMDAGRKLISFLNGRTAIVPLSGGYDSRLIVSLLKKLNYTDVICFTYGKPNPEVPISKLVAEKLGYEWHFVDFTTIDVSKIQSNQHYQYYLDFAANGYAMPYLMEYFAVTSLKQKNVIPENAVFLPGHSGDFLGGSYISKTVKNTLPFDRLATFIESKYFVFTKKSSSKKLQLRNRINQSLLPIGKSYIHNGYNMTVEEWDFQEKLAKFIFHSSQVFNFFGHEVYFPLWDRELRDFFRTVPFEHRENKKLYDDVLDRKFFKPFDISFSGKELKASQAKVFFQKIKDAVRYFFPWKMVLKRVNNADWPHYQLLTKEMLKFIENDSHSTFINFKTYNAVICAWYLKYIQKKYKQ